jgi:23S rRNA (cytidine1920-2'-O)/16S rRNA (cytidine1409-2'-O)-methyltransferase
MARTRLDRLLVTRGLAPTREKAQAMILAGSVSVDGRRVDKAGAPVEETADVTVTGPPHPYVSRGGVKLAAALDRFRIDPSGLVCLDVGASTGGFTDCLLQRGAVKVYAVDVGYGQLDAKLRGDPRVILREKVNARSLSRQDVPEPVGLAAIDVSFISTRLVLPAVVPLVVSGGFVVVLVKPQFEAGPADVGKGGVVRDPEVHRRVVDEVLARAPEWGARPVGVEPSPLLGPKGNREFFVQLADAAGGS